MSPTARSIFYYSFYMMGTGLGLFFIPNTILGLFELAPTTDAWIRMLGLLSFCAGLLYFYCGRTNQVGFFRISVPERVIFFLGTMILVVFMHFPAVLAIIGSVDLFGAIWTGWALRQPE